MRNNKMTISIIAVLVISIISLGVAFAVFSTTLNINGSASVEATNWDIFFTTENDGAKPTQTTTVPEANITPSGTATNNLATIVATTFTWSANFKSPGDKIIYTIYVKNGGNYNARVSNISMPTITCTTDPKSACSELSYGLYTDTAGNTPLSTSFTVDAGDTEVFYLIAELSENYGGTSGANLVTTDVTSSTISATVTFEQTGTAVLNSGTTGGGTSGGNSGGSGSGSLTTRYLASRTYNSQTGEYDEEWVDDVSSLDNTYNDTYIKKVGDSYKICLVVNSTEYCFDENTTRSSFAQTCSAMGGYLVEGLGSDFGPDYSIFGVTCFAVPVEIDENGDISNDLELYPNWAYEIVLGDLEYPNSYEIDTRTNHEYFDDDPNDSFIGEFRYQDRCNITYPSNNGSCYEQQN